MPHPLSTKLDSTLRYAAGFYGIATSVLAQIAQALADSAAAVASAAAATTTANAASTAAASATTTANAASTAATAATSTANSASTTAAAASSAASSATTTANTASSAASAATTTANSAVTTANGASTAAISAQNIANDAADDAAVAQASINGHIGTGASAHALATTSVHGFQSATDKTKLDSLAAGQAATLGKLTVDAVLELPSTFSYAASVAIDTAAKNDYVASATLTGNITFTFTNVAAGRQGVIAVRQDATGGRTVTFTPPGSYALYRDSGTTDLQAASGANALTLYTYAFFTVGGANMMFIGKLTPVAAS